MKPSALAPLVALVGGLLASPVVTAPAAHAAGEERILYNENQEVREHPSGALVVGAPGNSGSGPNIYPSPDRSRLALGFGRVGWQEPGIITLAGVDGACPQSKRGSFISSPANLTWSLDSVRLAWANGREVLVTTSGDPTDAHRVGSVIDAKDATWLPSPYLDLIAFAKGTGGGDWDINTVDVATGQERTIVGGPTIDHMPAFARDASAIAFRRDDGMNARVAVANIDGSNARVVAPQLDRIGFVSWTSGGDILAVNIPTGTSPEGIYRIDPQTGSAELIRAGWYLSAADVPLGPRSGYVAVAGDGRGYGFGASCDAPAGPIGVVGAAAQPKLPGHWQVSASGQVRALGTASHLGDLNGVGLSRPIVGMASTPSGNGYWLVASDGGIFNFGDASFHGSTGAIKLNQPIVGMASTPSGKGYWLVASDGGMFSFGDASFHGSTGAIRLNRPIVGMQPTTSGNGYWLVASDGGIFNFGDASFKGSTGGLRLNQPIVGMATQTGVDGYWLVARDGGVFNFGAARFRGSTGSRSLGTPVVALVTETIPG